MQNYIFLTHFTSKYLAFVQKWKMHDIETLQRYSISQYTDPYFCTINLFTYCYLLEVIFLKVSNGVFWGFSMVSSLKELSLNSFHHFCSNGKSANRITKLSSLLHCGKLAHTSEEFFAESSIVNPILSQEINAKSILWRRFFLTLPLDHAPLEQFSSRYTDIKCRCAVHPVSKLCDYVG